MYCKPNNAILWYTCKTKGHDTWGILEGKKGELLNPKDLSNLSMGRYSSNTEYCY